MDHPPLYLVEFVSPYSFQLPDSIGEADQEPFVISIDGVRAELRLKLVVPQDGFALAGGSGYTAPRDRLGRVTQTHIQITFGEEYIENLPPDVEEPEETMLMGSQLRGLDKVLVEDAASYFNRLVDVYRVMNQKFWLRPLNPQEIVQFVIRKAKDEEDGLISEKQVGWSGGSIRGGSMPEEKMNEFRGRLFEESVITLTRRLDLDAQDKIDVGDYSLAVINSHRLFEVWLRRKFRQMLTVERWSDNEIEDRMTNGDGEFNHINVIADQINADLGFNLRDQEVWDEWDKNTREFRNKVLHEGYDASELDAIYAYYYSRKAMERFAQNFGSKLMESQMMEKD